MTPDQVLLRAQQVLTIFREICADHDDYRRRVSLEIAEMREVISNRRLVIAQNNLGIAESITRIQQLLPPRSKHNIEGPAEREQRVMADLQTKANIRAAVDRHLQAQARQAALDRAVFIAEMRQNLAPELWDEALDEYDRRLFESREDGKS